MQYTNFTQLTIVKVAILLVPVLFAVTSSASCSRGLGPGIENTFYIEDTYIEKTYIDTCPRPIAADAGAEARRRGYLSVLNVVENTLVREHILTLKRGVVDTCLC